MSTGAPKKRGRPPLLTNDRILTAAMNLLTEAPVNQFTMQRVSKRLKVAPMTLYGYFPSRDALLQAVAEELFTRLDLSAVRKAESWADKISTWCHLIRAHLQSLPPLFQLITDPAQLTGAWMETSDPLVEALDLADLSPPQVALYARWIGRTLIGTLVVESSFDREIYEALTQNPQDVLKELSAGTVARLQTLIPHSMGQTGDRHFDLTVASILRTVEEARPNLSTHSKKQAANSVLPREERN